jgi:hypothetical protein
LRKAFVLVLILSHLFCTSGFSINVHECGGQKSFTLLCLHFGETCDCDHASETMDDACCKDKKIQIKPQIKDKIICKTVIVKHKINLFIPYAYNVVNTYKPLVLLNNSGVLKTEYHPPRYMPPLYILYGALLI